MAPASSKTMWIAFYYMTVPLGVVLGFILSPFTVSVLNLGFQYAFLIQGVILFALGLLFLPFSHHYYD